MIEIGIAIAAAGSILTALFAYIILLIINERLK